MHPGAWLVWATSAGVSAMTTTNPFYLVMLVAAAWIVQAAVAPQERRSFRTFALFGLAALTTRTLLVLVWEEATAGNLIVAALEGARVATMLVVFGAFNAVAEPASILRLAPRRFHEPALAAALALNIAPRIVHAARTVREAQQIRGIDVARWRSAVALAVPVLETGMEDAVTLAESMDARGHGRGRRSRYRRDPFGARSWAVAAAALAGVATFLLAGNLTGADLTFDPPLRWPDASPVLIAAALVFALPAAVERPR